MGEILERSSVLGAPIEVNTEPPARSRGLSIISQGPPLCLLVLFEIETRQ